MRDCAIGIAAILVIVVLALALVAHWMKPAPIEVLCYDGMTIVQKGNDVEVWYGSSSCVPTTVVSE